MYMHTCMYINTYIHISVIARHLGWKDIKYDSCRLQCDVIPLLCLIISLSSAKFYLNKGFEVMKSARKQSIYIVHVLFIMLGKFCLFYGEPSPARPTLWKLCWGFTIYKLSQISVKLRCLPRELYHKSCLQE